MDQNTELLVSLYQYEPRHKFSENQKIQISSEESLLSLSFKFLPFTHTPVMLWMCGTHEKRSSGETDMKEWNHFLRMWDLLTVPEVLSGAWISEEVSLW